jgi:ribonuclease P protein component
MIKRQIRAVLRQHGPALDRGLWLVRLRATFDRRRFVSPTSVVLRETARRELDGLLRRAIR